MPLNIDKKIVFIEYLGDNKNIVALEGYSNIKQIIAIDSTGLNPISWTFGEPDELQGFLSLEKFQGYLVESKANTTFPYTLYSDSDSAQTEKLITKKFQIARYVGSELNISSSSLADKVKVIYKIDKVNGESVPKTWTPGEDDSLQGFTKLENNEVYFIDSKQDSLPYVFWSTPTPTPTPTKKTVVAATDTGMGTDTPSGLTEYYGEQFGVYYQSPYQYSSLEYTELAGGDTTIVFANIRFNGQYFGNVSFQRRNIGQPLKIYANCKVYSGTWAEGVIELTLIGDDPVCSTKFVIASNDSGMGNDTPSGGVEYYGEGIGVYYQSPHLNSKLEYTETSLGDTTITFSTIKYDGQYFGNVSFQKKYIGDGIKIYANCKIYSGSWSEGIIDLTLVGNDPSCNPVITPSMTKRTIVASNDSGMGNDTPSGGTEYYGEGPGVYYQSPNQNSTLEYNDYSGGDATIVFATLNYKVGSVQYFGNVSFPKKYLGGSIKIYSNCKVYLGTWTENIINLSMYGKDPSCPNIQCNALECNPNANPGYYADCGLIQEPGYTFSLNCEVCECVRIQNTPTPTPTKTPTRTPVALALTPSATRILSTPTPTPTPLFDSEIIASSLVGFANTPSGSPEYYGEGLGIYFQTLNQNSKLIYKNLSSTGGSTQILFSILNFNSNYFGNISFQAKYVGQQFRIIHNCQVYSVNLTSSSTLNLNLLGQDPSC